MASVSGRTKAYHCGNGKSCTHASDGKGQRRIFGGLIKLQREGVDLNCRLCGQMVPQCMQMHLSYRVEFKKLSA